MCFINNSCFTNEKDKYTSYKSCYYKIDYFISDYSYECKDIAAVLKSIPQVSKIIPVFIPKKKELLSMPETGEISSVYGMRTHPILKVERMHNGIDIVQREGTPVKTVLDGIVSSVSQDKEMGKVVKIKHDNEIITVYAHLRDIYVKEQEQVKQGFIIGTVGKTGLAQTPHLHFEIWKIISLKTHSSG